jgi:hypothetical protein
MPNPTNYITPQKAFELDEKVNPGRSTLDYWKKRAKCNDKCLVCGDRVWRFGTLDMCFTCTTGESDPSKDYEVRP